MEMNVSLTVVTKCKRRLKSRLFEHKLSEARCNKELKENLEKKCEQLIEKEDTKKDVTKFVNFTI